MSSRRISHARIASLLLEAPLMITKRKLAAILTVVGPRIGYVAMDDWDDDEDDIAYSRERPAVQPVEGIAVVDIMGSLVKRARGMDAQSGLTGYESLEQTLLDAATNPSVKGILLNVDSGGGSTNGAFDLADFIYSLRSQIPIYAIANDNALSAGYLLASSAEQLWVTQTSAVGSIGVLAVHADQSVMDQKIGVKYTTIKYGDRKDDYSAHAPLSDEALENLQGEVDRLGDLFVEAVARNRSISSEAVKATQAAFITPDDAVANGFADAIGTQHDAIRALLDRVGNGRRRIVRSAATAAATGQRLTQSTKETPLVAGTTTPTKPAAPPPNPLAQPTEEEQQQQTGTEQEETTEQTEQQPAESDASQQQAAATQPAATAASLTTSTPLRMSPVEIHTLNSMCLVAGQPALLSTFISRGMTFDAAQKELLRTRTEAAGTEEIQSHVLPEAGTAKAARKPDSLLAAVKRRLGGK